MQVTRSHKTCAGKELPGLGGREHIPPYFPTIHKRLAARPNFCISDSARALKHFRRAWLRAQTPWAFPESHSPRNHFCLGARHHPASHFYPTKDPAGPRGPQARNAAGTALIQPCGKENRAQRATISLPARGGKPSPPSTATSTKFPPSISSKSPKAFVL